MAPGGSTKRIGVLGLGVAVCLAGVVALATLASPAPARAGTPCWRAVVKEWVAGRVRKTHPLACYREAIANAPADFRLYSSFEDDLQRIVQSRVLAPRKQQERGLSGLTAVQKRAAPVATVREPTVAGLGIWIAAAATLVSLMLLALLVFRRRSD